VPRPLTGEVIEHTRKDGLTSFALRFRAYGERRYVTLGNDEEGWTRKRAEAELRHVLARVEAGIWRPEDHKPEPPSAPLAPTFHTFASEWYAARKPELKPKTRTDYEWRLSNHLLPYFAPHRIDQIDVALVDRFRAFKVREAEELRQALAAGAKLTYGNGSAMRPLSPGVINMLIGLLAAILETAVEYGHLSSNPARGRRRRVKVKRRRQSFLEADELVCVLDAASELDTRARTGSSPRREQIGALIEEGWRQAAIAKQLGITSQTVAYHVSRVRTKRDSGRRGAGIDRYAIMATLGCAGLRAHELCDLNVEDADIVHERLNVRDAKTPKGVRLVYTTPKLKGVLASYLGRRGGAVGDPLFPTETGARRTPDTCGSGCFIRSSSTPEGCVRRAGIRRCRMASRRTRCGARTARCGWRPIRRRRSRG
jgi:integrase